MNWLYMLKKLKHLLEAVFWNLYYGFPASRLKVIGITGTDGKTTTVLMISHILAAAGLKVGYISTVGFKVSGDAHESGLHVTTPNSHELQCLIRSAADQNLEYLILEVSSHALDQYRVRVIKFSVSGITNVTPEHLDYHQTHQKYLETKARLFRVSDFKIFNRDDKSYDYLKTTFSDSLAYSIAGQTDFTLDNTPLKLKSDAQYNYSNALLAVAIATTIGLDRFEAAKVLETFEFPPGRGEVIQAQPFEVIIDFAHTPNGLKSFMGSLPKTKGRTIHVFGCAGERDRYKRSSMGAISADYSDIIILTSEDPRSERVENINRQIIEGIKQAKFKGQLLEIPDRREAIIKAISLAKPKDLILITGKGPEKSNNIRGIEYPWDEEKTVREVLNRRKML